MREVIYTKEQIDQNIADCKVKLQQIVNALTKHPTAYVEYKMLRICLDVGDIDITNAIVYFCLDGHKTAFQFDGKNRDFEKFAVYMRIV